MSREYARTNVTIWQDSDFRALPFPAQHLYLTMWAHPDLSYCGVLDWRPGRLAALSEGWTAHAVRTFAACLAARHFIVVDDETEEVLVRSWVRWEEILKQPRLSVSYVKAFSAVASNTLRSVLVYELAKIRTATPDLVGFRDQRVVSVLANPSVSAKDLPIPEDPFGNGLPTGLGLAFGNGLPTGLGQTAGSVCLPPTTATTTTPLAPRKNTNSCSPPASQAAPADDFGAWWTAYPRKVGKGQAVKAYRAARKKTDAGTLLAAVEQQTPSLMARGSEFCPHPATWLNGERWTDEPPRPEPATRNHPRRRPNDDIDWDAAMHRAHQRDQETLT